jgi:steroid 5-alpha reductase family enzyme
MSFFTLLLNGFLISLIPLVLLWLVSIKIKNVSIIDAYWGTGFIILNGFYLFYSGNINPQTVLVFSLLAVWGIRLSLYLLWRNWGKGEDYRYQQFRMDYGPERYWWFSFFQVFLLQGSLVVVVSLPVLATIFYSTSTSLSIYDYIVSAIWMVGFFFESVADYQLTQFKRRKPEKGQILNHGLWKYSRHPNYFGNAVIWWAFGFFAIINGQYLTLIGPLIMNWLLLKVSGVSMLERTLVNTKPKYEEYSRTTNAFIPWFPKK